MKILRILALSTLGILFCFKPVSLSGNSTGEEGSSMNLLLLDTTVASRLADVMRNNITISDNEGRIKKNEALIKARKW